MTQNHIRLFGRTVGSTLHNCRRCNGRWIISGEVGHGALCPVCSDVMTEALVEVAMQVARRCADLAAEHAEHGEFVHGGRYECATAIYGEILSLIRAEYSLPTPSAEPTPEPT